MNPLISLLITLTCEVALVVVVGFVAERLLLSVRDRRRLWCAVLIGVGLLAAVELAGLRVVVRRWASLGSLGTPRPSEPRWVVTGVTGAIHPRVIEPSNSAQEASTPTDLPAPSRWTILLSALWLFGTIAIWVRSGYQRRQLQRVVRQSRRVEVSAAREIARRLGLVPERIQLCEAASFSGPVAFGVFRPTVLLPCGFVHRYGDLELKVLLAHELAHLAACDPLWLAISDFLSGLLWWHPAVWWSRRRLRATSEIAADEASCLIPGGRLALAEALVAFGNRLAGETSPAGFGVGGLKSDLATRVTRLLAAPVRASSRLMTRVTVAGTFCALLAIGMAPWPGNGAQPVVTAALESIGSLASKPPRATKVTAEAKSESSQTASRVPGFEPGASDSNGQPPSPRESLQSGESKPANGGNQDGSNVDSTLPMALEGILVPMFQIAEGPLQDLAQRLQQTLRDADPHKRNLRITVATQDLRIDQSILVGSGPAVDLLKFVADHCTPPVEWALHGNEIVFHKIASGKWPLRTQLHHVGVVELLAHIMGRLDKAGDTPSDINIQNEVRAFLSEHGVEFPQKFDSATGTPDLFPPPDVKVEQDERAFFLTYGNSLLVRASMPDQKRIRRALLEHAASAMPTTRAPVLTNAVDPLPTKDRRTLHTRLFQVDTQKFLGEIRSRRAKAGHPSTGADVQAEVRDFFVGQGVIALRFQTFSGRDDFNPPADETAVFLKQNQGIIFAQASDPDFRLIEQALLAMFQHTQSGKTEGASFVDPQLRTVSDSTLSPLVAVPSKPPRATKVTAEAKSESSQSASRVPGFEPGPSESNRQPPSPREFLQLGKTNLAVGGNPDSSKEGSTPRTGLGEILVPTFQITKGPLQDSVQRLQQILRDADPHKRDLRITVATKDLRIRQQMLQTGPVPADSLLQEIANSCTIPVEWTFHGNEIVFDKIASGEWPLTTRWYQVGPAKLLSHIRGRLEKAGGIVTDGNIQNETRTFLAENGVIIPKAFHSSGSTDPVPPKGAKALFLTKDGASLFVLASVPDHIQIHRALAVLQSTSGTMPTTRAQVSTDAVDAAPRKQ